MSSCVLHIQVTAPPPQPWLAALHLKSVAAASTICESGWSNDVSQDAHRLLNEALPNATMVSGHIPDPPKTSPTWPHMNMCFDVRQIHGAMHADGHPPMLRLLTHC